MEEDELSDEFLMDAIAGGAMWALERLHDRYSGRFYALAYRMTADHMVAEELVQDAFFTVWRSATSYTPLRTYPETGRTVIEWRRAEQMSQGAEEEERHEQNETVGSQ